MVREPLAREGHPENDCCAAIHDTTAMRPGNNSRAKRPAAILKPQKRQIESRPYTSNISTDSSKACGKFILISPHLALRDKLVGHHSIKA